MSVVVRFPPSNMSKQQYDSIRGELEGTGEWPAEGCQLHVLFGPEDNLRVSEVWESAEKQQAFGEKLGPRMEQTGMHLSGEVEVSTFSSSRRFERRQSPPRPQPRPPPACAPPNH